MPEWRDTLFKGRPKIGLDFFNAPRQRGNRTKCLVHSMGYGLCVDVQKSGTTQIQNVLDKGYNLNFPAGEKANYTNKVTKTDFSNYAIQSNLYEYYVPQNSIILYHGKVLSLILS